MKKYFIFSLIFVAYLAINGCYVQSRYVTGTDGVVRQAPVVAVDAPMAAAIGAGIGTALIMEAVGVHSYYAPYWQHYQYRYNYPQYYRYNTPRNYQYNIQQRPQKRQLRRYYY